jgi:prepilin peptidase CpaA
MTSTAALSLLQGVAVASLALAAAVDLKRRIIPNGLVLCVIGAGGSLRLLEDGPTAWRSLGIALAVFVPLGVLAYHGAIGGGDAKMISATMLLVQPAQTLLLIAAIALAGGVLAVGYFIADTVSRVLGRLRPMSAPSPIPSPATLAARLDRSQLPYGLAILAGVILTLVRQP